MSIHTQKGNAVVWVIIGIALFWILVSSNNRPSSEAYEKGDMSDSGGTPTFRYAETPSFEDDIGTTNNESNDQPVGFYGTDTMYACNQNSGNCYDLDVDSNGESVERIYFPNGGWVDTNSSNCDDGYCYVEDEDGTEWELEY